MDSSATNARYFDVVHRSASQWLRKSTIELWLVIHRALCDIFGILHYQREVFQWRSSKDTTEVAWNRNCFYISYVLSEFHHQNRLGQYRESHHLLSYSTHWSIEHFYDSYCIHFTTVPDCIYVLLFTFFFTQIAHFGKYLQRSCLLSSARIEPQGRGEETDEIEFWGSEHVYTCTARVRRLHTCTGGAQTRGEQ